MPFASGGPLGPPLYSQNSLGTSILLCTAIVLKWKSPVVPSINFWKRQINTALPLYKATYLSRGCAKKFHTMWNIWVAAPATNPG